jgi:serine protease
MDLAFYDEGFIGPSYGYASASYSVTYDVEDRTLDGQFNQGLFYTEEQVELLIDFEDDVSLARIEQLEDALDPIVWWEDLEIEPNSMMFSDTKITTLKIPALEYAEIKEKLDELDFVESLEHNAIFKVELPSEQFSVMWPYDFSEDFPNDPLYKERQWHLQSIGVEEAWKHSTGDGVIVAVIDTGVSDGKGKHARVPDLKDTEFVKGYNFVGKNADPSDGNSHGTHVAGTIAQSTNNGYGVAGVAYNAKIMPIKVLSDRGFGSVADIVEGIRFAADNGAHVINLSLGGGMYSKSMDKAVAYARSKNVFLACAAGNGSRDRIEYPAAYDGCNAVSAVGKSGDLAFYSSYGKGGNGTTLFMAAPGGDQKADGPEGGVWQNTIARGDPSKHGFFPFQGTSMATPHVAGVAALVIETLGVDDYDVDDVEKILADTASAKSDEYKFGNGVLNAKLAVLEASDAADSEPGFLAMALMLLLSVGVAILVRVTK